MEWIKITLCATFFFLLILFYVSPEGSPNRSCFYVHRRTPGNMHFCIGFLYPCENVFMK